MKKPLQLAVVDIDIESALDSIEPHKVRESMITLGYRKELSDKYHGLNIGGQVAIHVNGVTGNKFGPNRKRHTRFGIIRINQMSRYNQQNMQMIIYGISTFKQKIS